MEINEKEKEKPFITHLVKKGDKFLVEIEIIRDMDLINDDSLLYRLLYSEDREEINKEFVVTTIYFRNITQMKQELVNKLQELIRTIQL